MPPTATWTETQQKCRASLNAMRPVSYPTEAATALGDGTMRRAKLPLEMLPEEWRHLLLELRGSHSERFLADNERIWQTGSILIPAAGAGFFAIPDFLEAQPLGLVLIGALSIAIIYLWHVMAEGHRSFQNTHDAWVKAIDEELGIQSPPSDKTASPLTKGKWYRPEGVRGARRVLVCVFTLCWLGVALFGICRSCGWCPKATETGTHSATGTNTSEVKPTPKP